MTRPHDAQTPRTDYAASLIKFAVVREQYEVVSADFARQLELELQAERERGRRVREETIEECAKVCALVAGENNPITMPSGRPNPQYEGEKVCKFAAQAIRALSRAESAPEGGKQDVPTVREE